jgi:hypothetical protein
MISEVACLFCMKYEISTNPTAFPSELLMGLEKYKTDFEPPEDAFDSNALGIFLPLDSEVPRMDNVMLHYSAIA